MLNSEVCIIRFVLHVLHAERKAKENAEKGKEEDGKGKREASEARTRDSKKQGTHRGAACLPIMRMAQLQQLPQPQLQQQLLQLRRRSLQRARPAER